MKAVVFSFFFFAMLMMSCNQEDNDQLIPVSDTVGETEDTPQLKAHPLTDCNNFQFPYSYNSLFRQSTDGDIYEDFCLPEYAILTGTDTPLDRYYDCRHEPVSPPLDVSVKCTDYIFIPLYKICAIEEPNKPSWHYSFYPAPGYNNFDPDYFMSSGDSDFPEVFEEEDFIKIVDFAQARIDGHFNGVSYPFMQVDFLSTPYGCSCLDVTYNCINLSMPNGSHTSVCGNKRDVYVRVNACAYEIGGF